MRSAKRSAVLTRPAADGLEAGVVVALKCAGEARRAAARWVGLGLLAAVMSGAISGCASATDETSAVMRGQALAERSCGNCHGMGLTGDSTFPGAPAFRDMHVDFNAISYQRRMAAGHHGHISMPPAEISLEDVADVRAYVSSLRLAGER